MADQPGYSSAEPSSDRGSSGGIPRWLKLLAIIVAIGALLFIAVQVMGGGGHERPSHSGAGNSVTELAATRTVVGRTLQ